MKALKGSSTLSRRSDLALSLSRLPSLSIKKSFIMLRKHTNSLSGKKSHTKSQSKNHTLLSSGLTTPLRSWFHTSRKYPKRSQATSQRLSMSNRRCQLLFHLSKLLQMFNQQFQQFNQLNPVHKLTKYPTMLILRQNWNNKLSLRKKSLKLKKTSTMRCNLLKLHQLLKKHNRLNQSNRMRSKPINQKNQL